MSGYWGVVELRVEGIGGRWSVAGESSPASWVARVATVAGGGRLGVARGRRPGNLLWWAQAVVREFLLRSKAADRGMGTAWARGRRRAVDGAASGSSTCAHRRVRTRRVAPA
jgi:hypothetical protein